MSITEIPDPLGEKIEVRLPGLDGNIPFSHSTFEIIRADMKSYKILYILKIVE